MTTPNAEARCWISALTVSGHASAPYMTRVEGDSDRATCLGICPIGRAQPENGVKLRVVDSSYWRSTDGVAFSVTECNGTQEMDVAARSRKSMTDLDIDMGKQMR